jgi:hypothetical protein
MKREAPGGQTHFWGSKTGAMFIGFLAADRGGYLSFDGSRSAADGR